MDDHTGKGGSVTSGSRFNFDTLLRPIAESQHLGCGRPPTPSILDGDPVPPGVRTLQIRAPIRSSATAPMRQNGLVWAFHPVDAPRPQIVLTAADFPSAKNGAWRPSPAILRMSASSHEAGFCLRQHATRPRHWLPVRHRPVLKKPVIRTTSAWLCVSRYEVLRSGSRLAVELVDRIWVSRRTSYPHGSMPLVLSASSQGLAVLPGTLMLKWPIVQDGRARQKRRTKRRHADWTRRRSRNSQRFSAPSA